MLQTLRIRPRVLAGILEVGRRDIGRIGVTRKRPLFVGAGVRASEFGGTSTGGVEARSSSTYGASEAAAGGAAANDTDGRPHGAAEEQGEAELDLPTIARASWVDTVQRIRNKGVFRQGTVVRTKMDKTAVVEVPRLKRFAKLQFTRRWTTDYFAHDEHNECGVGDKVLLRQCRPISKNKSWYVQQILRRAETL